MTHMPLQLYSIPRMLRHARRPFKRFLLQKELQRQTAFASELCTELLRVGHLPADCGIPTVRSAILTRSDVAVIKLNIGSQGQELLLKLPVSNDATMSCARHEQVLKVLHQQAGLQSFLELVPNPVASGTYSGRAYYLESVLSGSSARDVLERNGASLMLQEGAARAIAALHAATAHYVTIDDLRFEGLVLEHTKQLHRLAKGRPDQSLLDRQIARLEDLLRRQFLGRTAALSWIHGDFWLGNVLVEPASGMVSGIVDWDRAVPDALPLHDLLHLFLYSRKLIRGTELGEEVVRWLEAKSDSSQDRVLSIQLLHDCGLPSEPELLRAAVLLYWLRLVAVNLARYPKFHTDSRWLQRNVFLVLQQGL